MRNVPFKSGFIALIGAPNVGKSTLLNQILGEKISITSGKPQTTRNRILGVLHMPHAQCIFFDTPGVHPARQLFNKRIVRIALDAFGEVDGIVYVIDADRPDEDLDAFLLKNLKKFDTPVVLAINKVDLIKKETLLPLIDIWHKRHPFHAIVPVSALKNIQTDQLLHEMSSLVPEGPPYFPEDTITDQPLRRIASEMIREKIFHLTSKEVPYAVAVTIDKFKERPDKNCVDIEATIHVERVSQKGIIIGKKGGMLKKIGSMARTDIQRMVGAPVFLRLWVRVQKNWRRDKRIISGFGY
jgi:GTP-binding protein Era